MIADQDTISKFREGVEEFVRIFCQDYMRKTSVEFNEEDDELSVTLTMEDDQGRKWTVPLFWSVDELRIDIGDAGTLDADGHGLFVYLWFEACALLPKQK